MSRKRAVCENKKILINGKTPSVQRRESTSAVKP